ncbi:MAG TPA: hypothetical protein VGA40_05285 [Candidatus Acidoferrales bacterium]
MAEKIVIVGIVPEAVVVGPADQVTWISDAGNLRVEFDANRSPFSSNIFQAPPGVRLISGTPRPGTTPGSYKYRVFVNDVAVARGEIIFREK